MEFRKMVTMTLYVRQQKRHRYIKRTDFWTLWEKVRVGWFERTALKHVYYHMWNRWPVQVQCMKQGTQSQCTGTTQRDGMGKEAGGGSGWSTHVHLWLIHVSSVQSLSRVGLFETSWTTACQASLSITNSQSLPKLRSIELVMPSNHLILCCPLLLLPSIFPNIRVFSSESALHINWPKYWSFSFSIRPSNEYSGLISFRMDRVDPHADSLKNFPFPILSRIFFNNTVQKHQFFGTQRSL